MPKRQTISREDKLRIIRAHFNGEDYLLTADTLGIKRSTARKILSMAQRRDDPEELPVRQRGGANNIKVNDEMRLKISEILDQNPWITLNNLNQELRRQFPSKPTITDRHLGRLCNGMLYTVRKMDATPIDRNQPDVETARRAYATWFLEVARVAPLVIYVDECMFNLWTQRTRGVTRGEKGDVRTRNLQRWLSMTLILAISSSNGVEEHRFMRGGITAPKFSDFFKDLEHKVGIDSQCIFILDSSPCHSTVQPISEAHSVYYLPPCSQFFSPVENAFTAWKADVKNRLSHPTVQASLSAKASNNFRSPLLTEVGEEAIPVITPGKCSNWEQQCIEIFPKCVNEEDIVM